MSEFPILRSYEWSGPLRGQRLKWELAAISDAPEAVAAELARDAGVLPSLTVCAVWGPAGVRAQALSAAARLLGEGDSVQLFRQRELLGNCVTRGSVGYAAPPGQDVRTHLEAEQLLRKRSGHPGVPAVRAALFSFHRSGWVREVATRYLAACETGFELPFLLLRRNDWVKPIREAAAAALDARLSPEHATHLLRHLGLLRFMETWSRAQHGEYLQRVRTMFSRPEASAALVAALSDRGHPCRRDVAQLAVRQTGSQLQEVVRLLASDRDPVLRFRAAQAAERAFGHEPELRDLLGRLSRDHFVPCASTALWLLTRRFAEAAKPTLWASAMSRSGALRELARGLLSEFDDTDLPAFYFEQIEARGPRLAGAIRGMSEVGEPSDHELLLPFLRDPSAGVRAAALQGIARLDATAAAPHLHAALQDRSDSVAKSALRTLLQHLMLIRPVAVETTARYGASATTRQLAFVALARSAPWRATVVLIEMWSPFDPQSRHREQVLMRRLRQFGYRGVFPPADQLIAIENALARRAEHFGSKVLQEIGLAARMWRRLADADE